MKKKWTYETCYEKAKEYKTRGEFKKGCSGAYQVARKKGWLDNYTWFKEVVKPREYWEIYENNCEKAKEYKTRGEFKKGCWTAYDVALKKNG